METLGEFVYLGDRVSGGGRCEAVVTARKNMDGLSLANVVCYYVERGFP